MGLSKKIAHEALTVLYKYTQFVVRRGSILAVSVNILGHLSAWIFFRNGLEFSAKQLVCDHTNIAFH